MLAQFFDPMWDPRFCPDANTCTQNCALDGVDHNTYSNTYGIHINSGDELELKFVTQGQYSKNIGSRTYLLDSSHERSASMKVAQKKGYRN